MTKQPPINQHAALFANGFTKGRESKVHHLERAAAKKATRMAYLEKRIKILALWRRTAIDRLSIGPDLIKELDRTAKGFGPNPETKS